jgi:hypothetical protein
LGGRTFTSPPGGQRRAATATVRAYEPAFPIPASVLRYPIVGEVRRFDGAVPPRGWAFCDGRVLPVAQFPRLFAVLGRTAGRNAQTNFALPRALAGYPAIIALDGWIPASPAMLAAARRAENSAPDVSVPGVRVLGRQGRLPADAPPAAKLPPWWPGTPPSEAFVRNQLKLQAQPESRTAPVAKP